MSEDENGVISIQIKIPAMDAGDKRHPSGRDMGKTVQATEIAQEKQYIAGDSIMGDTVRGVMAKHKTTFNPDQFKHGINIRYQAHEFNKLHEDNTNHLRSLKDGGWKKCTQAMAEKINPEKPHMIRGLYVNEHFPGYKIDFDKWGNEFVCMMSHGRGFPYWDPDAVSEEFCYMTSFKKYLKDIAVSTYIQHARLHRPDDHPDWIAQATNMDPIIIWNAYDQYAQGLLDEYWGLSHQKRRHVEFPVLYSRTDWYVEDEEMKIYE